MSAKNRSDGYNDTVYAEKDEQLKKVVALVREKGFVPAELVQNEVSWFYGYSFHSSYPAQSHLFSVRIALALFIQQSWHRRHVFPA